MRKTNFVTIGTFAICFSVTSSAIAGSWELTLERFSDNLPVNDDDIQLPNYEFFWGATDSKGAVSGFLNGWAMDWTWGWFDWGYGGWRMVKYEWVGTGDPTPIEIDARVTLTVKAECIERGSDAMGFCYAMGAGPHLYGDPEPQKTEIVWDLDGGIVRDDGARDNPARTHRGSDEYFGAEIADKEVTVYADGIVSFLARIVKGPWWPLPPGVGPHPQSVDGVLVGKASIDFTATATITTLAKDTPYMSP